MPCQRHRLSKYVHLFFKPAGLHSGTCVLPFRRLVPSNPAASVPRSIPISFVSSPRQRRALSTHDSRPAAFPAVRRARLVRPHVSQRVSRRVLFISPMWLGPLHRCLRIARLRAPPSSRCNACSGRGRKTDSGISFPVRAGPLRRGVTPAGNAVLAAAQKLPRLAVSTPRSCCFARSAHTSSLSMTALSVLSF